MSFVTNLYIYIFLFVGAKDLSPSVVVYCIYAMIFDTKINDLQQWKTATSKNSHRNEAFLRGFQFHYSLFFPVKKSRLWVYLIFLQNTSDILSFGPKLRILFKWKIKGHRQGKQDSLVAYHTSARYSRMNLSVEVAPPPLLNTKVEDGTHTQIYMETSMNPCQ